MIPIVADTHTHTIACDHAYSTITENAVAAAEKGLKFLAMTEHTPSMPGAPSLIYFAAASPLPRFLHGVMILRGAEVNIMDYEGALDLPDSVLEQMEWVIASLHTPCIKPKTIEEHTACWLRIAENPLVDVIGHCGDSRFAFDHEPVIRAFAEHGKIVEINSHSPHVRPGSKENCPQIARLCARYGVPVVVSSDAHHHTAVGGFDDAIRMLEEINFPRELILNADRDRFLTVAREKSGRTLTDEV